MGVTMSVLDSFAPLHSAIAYAESWTSYVNTRRDVLARDLRAGLHAAADNMILMGIQIGESLPVTWRLAFDHFFRPGQPSWTTNDDLEAIRQAVRGLFFTAREAMDATMAGL